jgi:serine/threonine-protein kinase
MLVEGATQPFIDPRGEWVAFVDDRTRSLKRIPLAGGSAQQVVGIPGTFRGGTWGNDGSIVFGQAQGGGQGAALYRIPDGGGEPTLLAKPNRQVEGDYVWPRFLPGGRALLFTIYSTGGIEDLANGQIAVLDLGSSEPKPKPLLRGGTDARYVSSGHLVYLAGSTIRAIAFDLDRLETVGADVEVLSEVGVRGVGVLGDFDVASDGTLVYSTAGGLEQNMVWVDRQSREEKRIPAPARVYSYPRLSGDGTRVALDVAGLENRNRDIQVWNLVRNGPLVNVTKNPAQDRVPLWLPGDEYLIFGSQRDGQDGLFWQRSDGTGVAHRLTSAVAQLPLSISGSTLLVHEGLGPAAAADVMSLALPAGLGRAETSRSTSSGPGGTTATADGASIQATPLVKTAAGETNAEVSTDGRWLAYESNGSGEWQVYVSPYPDPNSGPHDVVAAGRMPLWSRDGRELFYVTSGVLMSVPIGPGTTWSQMAGTPVKVLDTQKYFLGTVTNPAAQRTFRMYDYDHRNRRFLMLKSVEAPEPSEADSLVFVVENWFEDLRRLVPPK